MRSTTVCSALILFASLSLLARTAEAQETPAAPVPAAAPTTVPARPVVPPWVESMSMVHSVDAVPVVEGSGEQDWQPGLGALPLLANPFGGPSSGLIVNLATGNLTYLPKPDLKAHNNTGSDALFTRSYRSEVARSGYGSPGLPVGWVHTWDISATVAEEGKADADLILTYPNRVREPLKPEVGPDGKPTGKFVQPNGRPFAVAGVPSATTPGTWEQFVVVWRDGSRWTFTLGADRKTYVLRQIDDLLLDWDDTRRIRSLRSAHTPKAYLMVFEYRSEDGMLVGVTEATNRRTSYLYQVPPPTAGLGSAPVLVAVSTLYIAGQKLPDIYQQTYSYTVSDGKGLMDKVSVPNNGGYTTATVVYRNQKVAALVDANENRRIYTYLPTGTRVEVWGKNGTRPDALWTDNIDTFSRHTGTTNASGHSTSIQYGKGQ